MPSAASKAELLVPELWPIILATPTGGANFLCPGTARHCTVPVWRRRLWKLYRSVPYPGNSVFPLDVLWFQSFCGLVIVHSTKGSPSLCWLTSDPSKITAGTSFFGLGHWINVLPMWETYRQSHVCFVNHKIKATLKKKVLSGWLQLHVLNLLKTRVS